MRVISIDVGIKHLAFCITEFENDGTSKIIDWNMINVMKDENLKCIGKKKDGTPCTSDCKQYGSPDNKVLGFCGRHSKYYKQYINDNHPKPEVKDIHTVSKCKLCDKKGKFKINYKSVHKRDRLSGLRPAWYYCTSHKNKLLKDYEKNIKIHKYKKIHTKNIDVGKIKSLVVKSLKEYNDNNNNVLLKDIDVCLVEQQPRFNQRMVKVAEIIQAWFEIMSLDQGIIINVKNYRASNKLNVENDNTEKELSAIKDKKKQYDKRKELSIKYTLDRVGQETFNKYCKSHDKYDDLCDTFLMCLMYYKQQN